MTIQCIFKFTKGYIADPYWPARERLINIQKISGINRVRTEARRVASLEAYLGAHGMTMDDYRLLEEQATRPFYTLDGGEIVVPAHQLHGMIAQAAALAPASVRLARAEQIRILLEFSDLRTGKTKPDGIWERFVLVKSGPGKSLSNQRGLRSNPYISDFRAAGTLRLTNPNPEDAPKTRQFVAWAGHEIGVGAARKLGWGRFDILSWKEEK